MQTGRKITYGVAGSVALATFAVYLRALQNDFVILDDDAYILENLHIRSFGLPFLRWAFFHFSVSNWHPVTWISHALDYALWGLDPLGHHLTSIFFHAVNTGIVVLLAMQLVGTVAPAMDRTTPAAYLRNRTAMITGAVTGMLFGLHPLHVESVAWVAERKDLLCAFFFLLAIMQYLRYAAAVRQLRDRGQAAGVFGLRGGSGGSIVTSRPYLCALGLFVLALLSKPMAVTLPLVLLILDWFPLRRVVSPGTLRSAVVEKTPFLVLSLASSVLTVMAQRAGGAVVPVAFVPLSARMLGAAHSLVAYLAKMAVPVGLTPYYPLRADAPLLSARYAFALLLVIAITAACVGMARRQKLWLSAWSYYVATLLPVIGIVQVGGQAMADRYTYLPSLGPFFAVAFASAWILHRVRADAGRRHMIVKAAMISAGIVAVLLLSALTYRQIGIWKNSLVVLNDILRKEPDNSPHVYLYRGTAFDKAGDPAHALADFNEAIALSPSYAEAYNRRGLAHWKLGRENEAIADFRRSIALKPSSPRPYFNLGLLLTENGLPDQATGYFDTAIGLDPASAEAYANRGVAHALAGRHAAALADFDKALALDDRLTDAFFNRGKLYLATGRKIQALQDFQEACSLGDEGGCIALRAARGEGPVDGK